MNLGKYAFYMATDFEGKGENGNPGVVEINAETLNTYILCGAGVKYVQFKEATTMEDFVFGRSNKVLKQIKFLKKVTLSDGVTKPFGSLATENVDLFVATAQDDTNGLQWLDYTFRTLTKEDKVWGN